MLSLISSNPRTQTSFDMSDLLFSGDSNKTYQTECVIIIPVVMDSRYVGIFLIDHEGAKGSLYGQVL